MLSAYDDKHITIDSARALGIGVRLAYLKRYDPKQMQEQLRTQLKTPYYSNIVSKDETYRLNNIEVKNLDWHDTCKENVIIVGDSLAVSGMNIEEHQLKLEFVIRNLDGEISLQGYSTHPKDRPKGKCLNLI